MKRKAIESLVKVTAISVAAATGVPTAVMAAEVDNGGTTETQNTTIEDEEGQILILKENPNLKVTEVVNEDGSKDITYEYEETVNVKDVVEAIEKKDELKKEQEEIKSEIESNGGSYDYTIEIVDKSTTEELSESFSSKTDAEKFAEKVDGTVLETEGDTTEGESSSKDGFSSEEEAQKWADSEAERLSESQISDSSEKVTTSKEVSKVDGTGTTKKEDYDITKVFDTEAEAEKYAKSFENSNYTITPIDGKWVCKPEKKEVTATDGDGQILYFDTEEEAEKYIKDNKLAGGIFETVEVVNTERTEKTETVVITATSEEEFKRKVDELYAEVAKDPNVRIEETKDYVLSNYETSINFDKLSEEEKRELMEQMEEDAEDVPNYTFHHLDLQTSISITKYDSRGNSEVISCQISKDQKLNVRVFTEIGGSLTEINMNTNITLDPTGRYYEICSTSRNLDLKKCFVIIEGTLEYGNGLTAPFSSIGYLNNNYNTCGKTPSPTDNRDYTGYDIKLSDFVMDSEGKITVSSSATKVYTISVKKVLTKYAVKYMVDDFDNGEWFFEEQYKVTGTYSKETEIPAEYMAKVNSKLTDLLYFVNYKNKNYDFDVVVDGEGTMRVIPTTEETEPETETAIPESKQPETNQKVVKETGTPKTGDTLTFIAAEMSLFSGIILALSSVLLKKKK